MELALIENAPDGVIPGFPGPQPELRPAYNIVLLEDHEIMREGIRSLIAQVLGDASVTIREASTFAQARLLVVAESEHLDMIVCDLSLPDSSGAETLQALRGEWSTIPLVVISGSEDWTFAVELLREGALGYIPKTSPVSVMLSALKLVFSGVRYFPDQVFQCLVGPHHASVEVESVALNDLPKALADLFPPRQVAVLQLMLAGNSNKEIARRLDISVGTVKNYVGMILRTFNTTSRTKAMAEAMKYTAP